MIIIEKIIESISSFVMFVGNILFGDDDE